MTRIRALWIIRFDAAVQQVVFFRRFTCFEKNVKLLQKDNYVPLPQNNVLLKSLALSLQLTSNDSKFIEGVDNCDRLNTAPVYTLTIDNKQLTVVAIIKKNWIYCCLPFIENDDIGDHLKLITSSSLPLVVDLLTSIGYIFQYDTGITKLNELDMFVNHCLPFGRLIDIDHLTFRSKMQDKPQPSVPSSKQPAWKPVLHKGRAHISFTITECIKSTQCDKPGIMNEMHINGYITCLAELEGLSPEIAMSLSHEDSTQPVKISTILIHPCVSYIHPPSQLAHDRERVSLYKLQFMPSLERFALCSYRVPDIKDFPVFGSFKLRGGSIIDLLLEMKLNPNLKNNFEYFEAKIPFHGRCLRNVDLQPSWGMANVSHDKQWIIWNLGSKFPGKVREVSLKASLSLPEKNVDDFSQDGPVEVSDYYAEIHFCVKAYIPSGINIDSKSITVSPPTKFKYTFETEFITSDYKIWNSYGNNPNPS